MRPSRRQLLTAALGASQVALLEKLGHAHAATGDRPTKLLTVFLRGGWMPSYFFSPMLPGEAAKLLPPPRNGGEDGVGLQGEPCFHNDRHIERSLDGSAAGGAPGLRPIVVPRVWDEAMLSQGQRDRRLASPLAPATTLRTGPMGWSWVHHRLWENTVVVHGIDQGTATHLAGRIAALSGIAGPEFRSPGIHGIVAHALADRFPDRAIAAATVGAAPNSNPLDLPAQASPVSISDAGSVALNLSQAQDRAWAQIRDRRALRPQLAFDGQPGPDIATTPLDDLVLRQARALRGTTNATTDTLLQALHDGYLGVSRLLARDVVSVLEQTRGVEHTPNPFWSWPYTSTSPADYFAMQYGSNSTSGERATYDLALRLLKSNLTSAVNIQVTPVAALGGGGYFDTHGADGSQFCGLYLCMEAVGRFLGEMKNTPASYAGGDVARGSLLDETLVVLLSDFGRTWPTASREGTSDHWPTTSVAFIGGKYLQTNRQIGGYDFSMGASSRGGYTGLPIDLTSENGTPLRRVPVAADVIFTIQHLLGIDRFLQGGPGVINGVGA